MPVGTVLLAWHGSLQHEAAHQHLAPRRWLNDLIALPLLSLWLSFPIYGRSHRVHRNFETLTEPWRDPESFYVDQATFAALSHPMQQLLVLNNTLLGRLLLGPFLVIGQFFYAEAGALIRGDRRNRAAWIWHLPTAALVLVWIVIICNIPLWQYLSLFILPGTSLTLIRSFAEHKAANTPLERTALVDAGGFFSALFLNNNLHYAHHKCPNLSWHALPAYYRKHQAQLLAENGGLRYAGGYLEICQRFLLRPIDRPAHPSH